MKTAGIYKLTNLINGKTYIGQTVNYRKRKNSHFSSLKIGKHHNEHLQRSFNLYGEENFEIEIVEKCQPTQLDEREIFYIKKLNSLSGGNGYNLMSGGQIYRKFTDEVKAKMSKSGKGRIFTEEHKRNISIGSTGKICSPESIAKEIETKRKGQISWGERNHNAVISNKVAEKIIQDLVNDLTVKECVEKYQVTPDTVYNLKGNRTYITVMPEIREALKTKTSTDNTEKLETAVEMYLDGYSQNKIAKHLNISRNTLRKELIKRNIDTTKHINQFVKQTNTEISN